MNSLRIACRVLASAFLIAVSCIDQVSADESVTASGGVAERASESVAVPDKLVVLTFDDSAVSHAKHVGPLLKKFGFGATFFITEGFNFTTNKKDYMTWEQISGLHKSGFEIGNHTRRHSAVTRQTPGQIDTDVAYIEEQCATHGIPKPISFCYPGYATSDVAVKVLKDRGYQFARAGGARAFNPAKDNTLLMPQAFDGKPGSTFEQFVEATALARNGRISVMTFHGIPDSPHPWVSTTPEKFERYLQHLADEKCTVIALRDVGRYIPKATPRQKDAPVGPGTQIVPPVLNLRVADVFTDNAVLQQGVKLPVWGTALAGEKVTVHFDGQTKTVQASPDGSWRLDLTPLESDAEGKRLIVESRAQRLEFQNVLVGEVWYASGQSNMQMTLEACARKIPAFREIIKAPCTDDIRVLRIDEPDSPEPLTQRQKMSAWQVDTPANRRRQSAVAYFFARKLHDELGVPVGIIEGSWGGKPIEGFIPRAQFEKQKALRPILALAEQNKLAELAGITGGVVVRNTAGLPGRIFNARVAPIAPYAVRGFVWYQGESNAGRGEDPRNYQQKMRALVEGWRDEWGRPELPFYFVQLPPFSESATGWIRLREEQRRSLTIKHTGMAVTIDLPDSDIHPANKLDVGDRLARWALAKNYGKKVSFSGPLFKSVRREDSAMRVEFTNADAGLMIAQKDGLKPVKPTLDGDLAHFEVADKSGKWYPAKGKIDGSTVLVRSSAVMHPIAVRYACSGAPSNANLYNQACLPASPFCSDLQLLPWQRPE